MKRWIRVFSALVPFLILVATACGTGPTEETQTGLPNPASVHCEEQGGSLEIRSDAEGGQSGVCTFDDGSECEEWSLLRGECTPGTNQSAQSPSARPDTEANPGVYIDEIVLNIMESWPLQVSATVRGNLADACVVLDDITSTREGNVFSLHIQTHREGEVCAQMLVPFEETVPLDVKGLPAGTYTVQAGKVSATFTFEKDNTVD